MRKELLEVGDQLRRWELTEEIGTVIVISSVTKTLAKTDDGKSFFRELDYSTAKPFPHHIAEVREKGSKSNWGRRFYLLKIEEPKMENYGWFSASTPDEESGWMYKEGEEKYYEHLKKWEEQEETK